MRHNFLGRKSAFTWAQTWTETERPRAPLHKAERILVRSCSPDDRLVSWLHTRWKMTRKGTKTYLLCSPLFFFSSPPRESAEVSFNALLLNFYTCRDLIWWLFRISIMHDLVSTIVTSSMIPKQRIHFFSINVWLYILNRNGRCFWNFYSFVHCFSIGKSDCVNILCAEQHRRGNVDGFF